MNSKKSIDTKTPFQRWYEKNKEEFNRKRREKYQKDPEVRDKAIENSRKQRQKPEKKVKDNTPATREHNGVSVRVYNPSEAAESVGRSIATMRAWERRKITPKTIFEGPMRLYTKNQINLMRWMVGEGNKASSKVEQNRVYQECSKVLHEKWRD